MTKDNISSKHAARKGFTIVELLISVGIVILLLGIIFFFINNSRAKAADARTQETLGNVRTIASEQHLEGRTFASVFEDGGSVEQALTDFVAQQGFEEGNYAVVASDTEFVMAFPLKAENGFWCVDSGGVSKKVPGMPKGNPPFNCDNVADSSGDGGDNGSGGSGGTGDTGGTGDGGGSALGEGDESAATIILLSGVETVGLGGDSYQMTCAGHYCVIESSSFVQVEDADPILVTVVDPARAFVKPWSTSYPSVLEFIETTPSGFDAYPTTDDDGKSISIPGLGTANDCAPEGQITVYSSEGIQDPSLHDEKSRFFVWCSDTSSISSATTVFEGRFAQAQDAGTDNSLSAR